MGEAKAVFPFGKLMGKRARLVGTVLRTRPIEDKIAVTQAFGRQFLPRFDDGSCRPVIDRRFPLDKVGDAQAYLESNENFGKVVIDVSAA
jgi:NADPH:quinone reductase-like Zn-dependent oxidoreductase